MNLTSKKTELHQWADVSLSFCRQNPNNTSGVLSDAQPGEGASHSMGPLQRVAQLPPRWQKLPNAKCKVPKELLLSLNTSERGCSATRFSHNGYFLACAEVNKLQENNLISVFEVNLYIRIDFIEASISFPADSTWTTCHGIYGPFANDL